MAKGKYEYWFMPEGLLKIEGWARDGLTDEQISENISITPSTLYEWKRKYSEISEALKRVRKYSWKSESGSAWAYLSEGYRCYFENPGLLLEKDLELFAYIEDWVNG